MICKQSLQELEVILLLRIVPKMEQLYRRTRFFCCLVFLLHDFGTAAVFCQRNQVCKSHRLVAVSMNVFVFVVVVTPVVLLGVLLRCVFVPKTYP